MFQSLWKQNSIVDKYFIVVGHFGHWFSKTFAVSFKNVCCGFLELILVSF